jgi:hypothetical protein
LNEENHHSYDSIYCGMNGGVAFAGDILQYGVICVTQEVTFVLYIVFRYAQRRWDICSDVRVRNTLEPPLVKRLQYVVLTILQYQHFYNTA